MKALKLLLLAASAAVVSYAPAALAEPAPAREPALRVAPPSPNPHDVFRRVEKVPGAAQGEAHSTKDCPCPMMRREAESTALERS